MCEGASKQSSEPKNYTAPGPRPKVPKFLDPLLLTLQLFMSTCQIIISTCQRKYTHN